MGAMPRSPWDNVRLPTAMVILALSCRVARAQIYQFEQVPVPEKKSLHTMYAFYVYSHQDAPDKSMGQPFVKFHSLASHPLPVAQKTQQELQAYQGVQLSILPYKDFWTLINPNKFCSTADDVKAGLAEGADQLWVQKPPRTAFSDVNMYVHTVHFASNTTKQSKDVQAIVRATGVYILVFSNCGDFADAAVSGSVIVKNSYGFLPGHEYHKLPFYGWLSLIYAGMAAVWMALSFRWWRELFHIQYCIAAVILLGLVEAFLWWTFFNDWNNSGTRGTFLLIMAILVSVVKFVVSSMLVLVASLGWGVTRPYLDHRTIMKVQLLSFLYIVMDFIRESVLSFRHSHSLSLTFVLLCLLPVALLNGAIFYWIFTALSSLMETLRERRQHEKLLLFERLWKILVAALAIASLTLLFQIFDLSRSISIRWHYQWFFADGVSHILFLFVLAAMMYLWAPHTNSQRYAYSHQVDEHDAEPDSKAGGGPQTVWADEDGIDEDGEDDSFWATTHGKSAEGVTPKPHAVSPDTIGSLGEADGSGAAAEKA
uniref:GOST seven transmembrane domain-containing protein n=1 Tax=Pyrodinium bahamense TaxID=73915 RepID=A0A7S0A837_9DINO|mmetsp:Transcript_26802/g.73691  ORF Transcript_26802/g.73691 Transcript_26802/m.73691 type:complete len:540 (+) Transcript_26802:51-1670(+)